MIPLTDEENKSYEKQKVCYMCKKGFSSKDNKKYHKDIIVITQKNLEELFIAFAI